MRVQISNGMFMGIIINMVYAKAIGITQGSLAREVGNDMWISTIFSTLQGIIMIVFVTYVIKRTPKMDIFEQSEVLLGKIFSKMIALFFFIFFLFAFGGVIATFVYHLKDFFLPDAPLLLFIIAAFIMGVYGIFFGLEVIGRMALIGVFSIIALNVLIILGSISEFRLEELEPIFESGFFSTLWASRHHDTDWLMATMMAAIILPHVGKQESWGKSGIVGIGLGGLFVVLWPILQTGVLTSEVTAQYFVACMQMARSAHIGLFLHRYELIMVAFFAISALIQIMMTFLCASIAVQRLFGLKDYRPVIVPVALILCGGGYWLVFDHQIAMDFLERTWVFVALSIGFGVPLLIWGIGFLFKKKIKNTKIEASS